MRSDVIKMYKDVHTWTGIVCGLALFIAFYAGALTMFKAPLERWASAPSVFGELSPLENVPVLVEQVLARYPEAGQGYQIVVQPSAQYPARMSWELPREDADEHHPPQLMHADLDAEGELVVARAAHSPLPQLVDELHEQVGLLLPHEVAMPIMGMIALLYGLALVSGCVVLLPTLVQDLFALRIGHNLKRMWLDVHNLLGVFSLPFHLVMAFTAVIFAFHDQIYAAQEQLAIRGSDKPQSAAAPATPAAPAVGAATGVVSGASLAPAALVARLAEQQPDFIPRRFVYRESPQRGPALVVFGDNPRYAMRSPEGGVAGLDPVSGAIEMTDYMPGMQDAWGATITSFFSLHFGTYGGAPIRWAYFFLGLAGAALFYTGNLLWLESRRTRQRARSAGAVTQRRSVQVMGALTVGVSLGCIAGLSLTIAAAKLLPALVADLELWHAGLYYAVFVGVIAWSFWRGVARAAVELLAFAAAATATIPLVSLLSLWLPGVGWNHADLSVLVDVVALAGSLVLALLARRTARRVRRAPADSLWFIAARAEGDAGDSLVTNA
ncbi:PepSY domain-containing protein [Mangrovimicrobium sediminis]|uniref:PepSY domain-containing protein n=1 Tax=Mangrovimicrobium sediminis TaxID=2562682 RepID=A0A4Z0M1Z2_9GAMM|nr:PepSY-associated TM helix domain-containing protein [Haliea sp. SAOS-164]TGD73388.1 PepSY domain-containing protein [Haliea sp. SAOS-164]